MVVSMQADASGNANARRRVLENRTNDAIARWGRTLSVRPVLDNITVSAGTARAFGLTGAFPVPNADLVLIMTARPSPNKPIAGYAVCKQKDQLGRCTVGHFNWVPELFKPAKAADPAVVGSEMHTALHEMAHLFGAILPGSTQADTPFIWPDGTKKIPVQHKVIKKARDPAFGINAKMMTWVTTPRVVAVARKYIDCPSIDGVPLEDVPLGATPASHWDARYLGPEFMSYGTCAFIFCSAYDAPAGRLCWPPGSAAAAHTRRPRLMAPPPAHPAHHPARRASQTRAPRTSATSRWRSSRTRGSSSPTTPWPAASRPTTPTTSSSRRPRSAGMNRAPTPPTPPTPAPPPTPTRAWASRTTRRRPHPRPAH
jgi:hypothetical protein